MFNFDTDKVINPITGDKVRLTVNVDNIIRKLHNGPVDIDILV